MTTLASPNRIASRALNGPAFFAVGCVTAIGIGWALMLVQFWRHQPDSMDRLLMLPISFWLCLRALRRFSPPLSFSKFWGVVPLILGAVLLPPVWFLFAQVGGLPILLWWNAAAVLCAVSAVLIFLGGWQFLRAMAFPIAFSLFALPWPNRVEFALQQFLQRLTTYLAAASLPWLGVDVTRQGFVLRLPSGDLGVIEACSGVKSVAAILAVATLIGYLRGFGFPRTLFLVVLSFPIIVLANVFRVVLNGVLQEWLGPWVNQGLAHELIGAATLLFGLVAVLVCAWMLDRGQPAISLSHVVLDPFVPPQHSRWLTFGAWILGLSLLASAGAYWRGSDLSPVERVAAPLTKIPLKLEQWVATDIPVPPELQAALACDETLHRVYRNASGQRIHTWVLFWSATSSVKDYIHHPDICWPNRGWQVIHSSRRPVALPPPTPLSMTIRKFQRDQDVQMIGYWTQDGRSVWSADEEIRAARGWASHEWVLERLAHPAPRQRTARLVVLVGADLWDQQGIAERSVEQFAALLADQLYHVCPWARPLAVDLPSP